MPCYLILRDKHWAKTLAKVQGLIKHFLTYIQTNALLPRPSEEASRWQASSSFILVGTTEPEGGHIDSRLGFVEAGGWAAPRCPSSSNLIQFTLT